jgi:hypothetical protein
VGAVHVLHWLEHAGLSPLPGRTSVEWCLIRHRLVTPSRVAEALGLQAMAVTPEARRATGDRANPKSITNDQGPSRLSEKGL